MAVTFGKVWRGFLDIIWIAPGNILAPPFYLICYLILQLLSRFFGSEQNIQEFSKLFIDLIKLNLLPRWTDTKESRKKDKKFDQNSKFIYIVLCGIPSFIYHMFCVIVNLFLCIFIFPAVIGFPFLKIHLRLAFIELFTKIKCLLFKRVITNTN